MRRTTDIYKKSTLVLIGFVIGLGLSALGIWAEFATWLIGAPSGSIAIIIFLILGMILLVQAYNK